MNCPRCNSIAYDENLGNGEFSITCELCGYYKSNSIIEFVFGIPKYKEVELNPQGLIFSKKENIQYFSKTQLKAHLELENVLGYSYLKNGKWHIKVLSNIPIEHFVL